MRPEGQAEERRSVRGDSALGKTSISIFGKILSAADKTSRLLTDFEHWSDDKNTYVAVVLILKELTDALHGKKDLGQTYPDLPAQMIRTDLMSLFNDPEWNKQLLEDLGFRAQFILDWLNVQKTKLREAEARFSDPNADFFDVYPEARRIGKSGLVVDVSPTKASKLPTGERK